MKEQLRTFRRLAMLLMHLHQSRTQLPPNNNSKFKNSEKTRAKIMYKKTSL